MLRQVATPARRALTRRLAAGPPSNSAGGRPWQRLHQPLGTVPTGTDHEAVRDKWGSDAMDKIQEVGVIEVEGNVAICDGGGGALGHPVEYIKVLVGDEGAGAQVCKYCGLKFQKKAARH